MLPVSNQAVREQQAIERRRKLEEERKKRIFDPKTRTMGIETVALEKQIAEKQAEKEAEIAREKGLEAQMLQIDHDLLMRETQINQERTELMREIDEFRLSQQQKQSRREWDLNNPQALKAEKPARIGNEDPRLSVSGAQVFEGEDLQMKQRQRLQAQQQRDWVIEQTAAQQRKKDLDEEMERLQHLRDCEVQLRLRELDLETERAHQAMRKNTAQFNLALAEEHHSHQSEQKHAEMMDGIEQIRVQMNSAWLNEDLHTSVSAVNPNRVRPDHFKGFFPQQTQAIIEMQRKQKEELQKLREQEAEAKRVYEHQQAKLTHQLIVEEHNVERARKEQAKLLAEELRRQAEEAKERKKKINEIYSGKIEESYFSQFGTTTR